jgi:saccharopine dehydrogenase-like NADP-dependent oxidoreductase
MVEELRARCTADPPRDLLVLVVVFRWGSSTEEAMMVDRYDPTSGLTAMARTTALTTSTVARLAVQRGLEPHGVVPMERLGQDEKTFRFVIDAMAGRGVRFSGSALAPANAARPASG